MLTGVITYNGDFDRKTGYLDIRLKCILVISESDGG